MIPDRGTNVKVNFFRCFDHFVNEDLGVVDMNLQA